ncbi:MAG: hypothetical protein AAFX80_10135 [Cyanobacteria bacterium J06639_18]
MSGTTGERPLRDIITDIEFWKLHFINIPAIGKEGPFFQFNSFDDLASFNFVSCVGERGKLGSPISQRDKSVAFSELQVVFGQAKLIDADYGGTKSGRRYTKSFPVSLELKAN